MSKSTKILLIVAAALVLIGGIVCSCAMMLYFEDSYKLDKYDTITYDITDEFRDIIVKSSTEDINFRISENDECKVVCYESKKTKHSVGVTQGVLNINEVDTRKWYDHIQLFSLSASPKITVYMPKGDYGNLKIDVSTGDVEIGTDFRFDSIDIKGSTGHVKCYSSALGEVKIKKSTGDIYLSGMQSGAFDLSTSTGDISLSEINCDGDLKVSVSTGDIRINDVSCGSFHTTGNTGSIAMDGVFAQREFDIKRSTGDIILNKCDASEISIKTDTGSVKGSLMSEKVFLISTDTGKKDVPETTSGGKCQITTDTGDIKITIVK